MTDWVKDNISSFNLKHLNKDHLLNYAKISNHLHNEKINVNGKLEKRYTASILRQIMDKDEAEPFLVA